MTRKEFLIHGAVYALLFLVIIPLLVFGMTRCLESAYPEMSCTPGNDYLLGSGDSCRNNFVPEVSPGVVMCRCKNRREKQ